ncbi:unnamed protein product [Effrenium voratum]|nr:unnamed protein product [Effrenium voratum]
MHDRAAACAPPIARSVIIYVNGLARQVAVVKCLLQDAGLQEDSCTQVIATLEVLQANCVLLGRDILSPMVESSYEPTRCTLCEVATAQIRQVSQLGLLECEGSCEQDPGCRGFDFDTRRSFCRTWGTCPSRSNEFGCQWTVYDRPASEASTSSLYQSWQAVSTHSTSEAGSQRAVAISATRPLMLKQSFVLSACICFLIDLHC